MKPTVTYPMDAPYEIQRLEEQANQDGYRLVDELRDIHLIPSERVLDAGCGTGVLARYLHRQYGACVDGVDTSDERVSHARVHVDTKETESLKFFCYNIEELPSDFYSSYDTAIARYVLEYTTHPHVVLRHLYNALTPNGRIVLIDADGIFVNLSTNNRRLQAYLERLESNSSLDLRVGKKTSLARA